VLIGEEDDIARWTVDESGTGTAGMTWRRLTDNHYPASRNDRRR